MPRPLAWLCRRLAVALLASFQLQNDVPERPTLVPIGCPGFPAASTGQQLTPDKLTVALPRGVKAK